MQECSCCGAVEVDNESPLPLILAQAVARGEKMDWIVQKATELGVVRIVPLLTERSEVRLDERRAEKRLAHWRAVAIAACEQSGRAAPAAHRTGAAAGFVARSGLDHSDRPRLALLPERACARATWKCPAGGAVLAVGPEGGWGERDLAALREADFRALQPGTARVAHRNRRHGGAGRLQALHGDLYCNPPTIRFASACR